MEVMAKSDDWKLCVDWLLRLKLISRNHKVSSADAEPTDLVILLRDGILLCELVNKLSPTAIDPKDYCRRPQMSEFLCLRNIRAFLESCKTVFRLGDHDLFEPSDLYEMKDFPKVVHTLSVVSGSELCRMLEIGPFYTSSKSQSSTYYNAPSTLSNFRACCDKNHYSSNGQKDEGDVYGRLVDFQPITREPVVLSKREKCVLELVTTEKNFTDALQMIKEFFMKPLKEILPQKDYDTIFLGIEHLYTVHSGFYEDLKKAHQNSMCDERYSSSTLTIPDCFITWKERFLIYGEYCSNLPKGQNTLDDLCAGDPSVGKKVEDSQMEANEGRFKLRDLLSVPMQRVLKYHLFLKELIKNTDKNHPELKSLERALDEIQDLSLYVNEVKRDNEALLLLEEIEHSITGYQMPENMSLKDYGKLLMDGELKLKAHSDYKTKNRYVFLFDKALLLCKIKGVLYSFKNALAVSSFEVEDVNIKEKERNFGFTFILGEKNRENAYTIGCKTIELRNKWIEAIRKAQDNFSPPHAQNQLHDFQMTSFSEPTICDVCRKLLRGVFFQGYKCMKTQMVVHKGCIEKAKDMTGPPRVPPKPTPSKSLSLNHGDRGLKGKAKVTRAYNGIPQPPNNGKPLVVFVDQLVDVTNSDDPLWFEGRCEGSEGLLPKDCVIYCPSPRFNPENHVVPVPVDLQRPPKVVRSHSESIPRPCSLSPWRPGCQNPLRNSEDGPLAIYPRRRYMHDISPASDWSLTGYDNLDEFNNTLLSWPWFVGGMSRDEASRKLEIFQDGTFLVRVSQSATRRGEYALSIKYGRGHPVKHIKIQKNHEGMFYIADCKMFHSIQDLVHFYQKNSLQPSFSEVPTTLQIPYKDALEDLGILGYCLANYEYVAQEPNQLTLTKGDLIAIVSQSDDCRGWWKGSLNGKVGYFPSAFVIKTDDEGRPYH